MLKISFFFSMIYKGLYSFLSISIVFSILFLASCKSPISSKEDQNPKISKLKIPDGFRAEHLYSPKEHGQGSWVAMTFDDKGRLITSDQFGNLYRITNPPIGYDTTTDSSIVEKLPINLPDTAGAPKYKIGYAHGLLYALHSLYVVVNDEGAKDSVTRPSGLYRLEDTNNDDVFDKLTLLKALDGRGEHGPHSPILGPDGKIYLVAGNFTAIPKVDKYLPPPVWKEDNLLPKLDDPRGFGVNLDPPGGWIARLNPDGSDWELFSAGFRNPFDIAFNEDGELFTYDSDMEWDLGLPWYRPTRVCHVISGSEFGYRENDLKWSPDYLDNLPPVLEIGQGSPTNVISPAQAHFPDKYRNGLLIFDWSFGIIYHVNLLPKGASYEGRAEEFVSGNPLPLTDGVIGPDGALYFLTGGRKLESDLYRVYYDGKDVSKNTPKSNEPESAVKARETRRELEKFQENPDPKAIEFAWPYLKDKDRFIRFAARVAIEHQPVESWSEKALEEKDPESVIQLMLALAHQGNKSLEPKMLENLLAISYGDLQEDQKKELLRTMEVILFRMGLPSGELRSQIVAYLGSAFPSEDRITNRLLSKVLVYLGDKNMTGELVPLLNAPREENEKGTATQSSDLIMRNPQYGMDIANMLANMPPPQNFYYAVVLSGATQGWTDSSREDYFKWFYTALDNYKGGHSYVGYVSEARTDALKNVPKANFAHYNQISGDSLLSSSGADLNDLPKAKGPGKQWKLDNALALVKEGLKDRNFEDGKQMFLAARCGTCHRVGSVGSGDIGPDLSQLGSRFSYQDILESIIEPSKTISSQYAATVFYLKSGSTVVGRLIKDEDGKYFVSQNPFSPAVLREIPKKEVDRTEQSGVSIMPPGMINSLNQDELEDLLAFLKSNGNPQDEVFK